MAQGSVYNFLTNETVCGFYVVLIMLIWANAYVLHSIVTSKKNKKNPYPISIRPAHNNNGIYRNFGILHMDLKDDNIENPPFSKDDDEATHADGNEGQGESQVPSPSQESDMDKKEGSDDENEPDKKEEVVKGEDEDVEVTDE